MRTDQSHAVRMCGAGLPGRRRQHGSIAVMAIIWLLVAIAVLGAIDVGNVAIQRRDVQRIADMAALAAVQPMTGDQAGCLSDAKANVTANVKSNNAKDYSFTLIDANSSANPTVGSDQIAVSCGRWDPSAAGTVSPTLSSTVTPANAAQVTVYRHVNQYIMGVLVWANAGPSIVSATATARATDVDSFSLNAGLASVGGSCTVGSLGDPPQNGSAGVLNLLLGSLLGSSINLSVGCYSGLANTNIRLGELSQKLNVSSPQQLIGTSVQLGTLLDAMAQALATTAVANVSANVAAAQAVLLAVRKASVSVSTQNVLVINPSQAQGVSSNPVWALIQLGQGQNDGSTANAAATANVDLLDILMTAAAIANQNNPSALTVDLSANLSALGLPSQLASLKLQILQPPSVAIGEAGLIPGQTPPQWRTRATNGQIGIWLTLGLDSVTLPGILGSLPIVGPTLQTLLSLAGLSDLIAINGLKLPLYLVVGGPATAYLQTINCQLSTQTAPSLVTIGATPSVASVCVGNAPTDSNGWLNLASNSNPCLGASTSVSASVNVPLVPAAVQVAIPINSTGPLIELKGTSSVKEFCVKTDGSSPACATNWTTNSNSLAGSAINLTNLSLGPLTLKVTLPVVGSVSIPLLPDVLLNGLQPVLTGVLKIVLPALDNILVPVLNLLGVQLGEATIHQIGLSCGTPQLVY